MKSDIKLLTSETLPSTNPNRSLLGYKSAYLPDQVMEPPRQYHIRFALDEDEQPVIMNVTHHSMVESAGQASKEAKSIMCVCAAL